MTLIPIIAENKAALHVTKSPGGGLPLLLEAPQVDPALRPTPPSSVPVQRLRTNSLEASSYIF